MITLGIDLGSNSVGSAWIDTDRRQLQLGVSVFPAGVDEGTAKRGEPKNQHRRQKRQLRRGIRRRARRKHALRRLLTREGLLPEGQDAFDELMQHDPWALRKRGLTEQLTPEQFGRILVHLNQRRGTSNVLVDDDEQASELGKVKQGLDRLRQRMLEAKAPTYGAYICDLREQRRIPIEGKQASTAAQPVRNRENRLPETEFLYPDRAMIRDEFARLWQAQSRFDGPLSDLLTDRLRLLLDNPQGNDTWQHRGALFGQRRQYWAIGTLGRCDLEPTDRCVPVADMYAQHYRVVETVNNIRIRERGKPQRNLTPEERDKVIAALRKTKKASVATVRKALGINRKAVKDFYQLNIENDEAKSLNTDWFYRSFALDVFGPERWDGFSAATRAAINRAILRVDTDDNEQMRKLRQGATQWWGLDDQAADAFIEAVRTRPKLENRLNLSRRAIRNLLPYMEQQDAEGRWLGQVQAREAFAQDADARDVTRNQPVTRQQRERYSLEPNTPNRSLRRFLQKHPGELPPAPRLSNPVVRKAIHEVRRHLNAYLRKFGRVPQRVVIELAREAKLPAHIRNEQLARNRARDKIRKSITEEYDLASLSRTQQRKAQDRIILWKQQKGICPYCGELLSAGDVAAGRGVETDHIVPFSRGFDNSLNNRVTCHDHCNRGKGNKTPREWLAPDAYEALRTRLAFFEQASPGAGGYFRKRDYSRKWDNLTREVGPEDEWRASQLTDTAYAAREVRKYLEGALYKDDTSGPQKVFFTKGLYTALLRKQWQLQDEKLGKNRADHRHHAIDAVAIGMTTPAVLQQLSRQAAELECRPASPQQAQPAPISPPWGTVESFRSEVIDAASVQIVSHRPHKRGLVGAFHKDTLYGPVFDKDGTLSEDLFTSRIAVTDLKPKHLRMPKDSEDLQRIVLDAAATRHKRQWAWRRMLTLPDPRPGKSGLVRDPELRWELRCLLRKAQLDPDSFTSKQVETLVSGGALCKSSGVPIRTVVLLWALPTSISIAGKERDVDTGDYQPSKDPRRLRTYQGQNNHHMEVRCDAKGRWSGRLVTAFEAAQRVRSSADQTHAPDPVDRAESEEGRFVMSLSGGETLHMRHPETESDGFFVVVKLDKAVHLVRHWDARPAGATDRMEARAMYSVPVSKLKALAPAGHEAPYKVRVDPLGELTPVEGD